MNHTKSFCVRFHSTGNFMFAWTTDFSATNFYSRILDNLVVEEVLETDFEVPKKTKKKHFHSGEGLLNFFAIS